LTISDTRSSRDDESGRLLGELFARAGFRVVEHVIVPDEIDIIQRQILAFVSRSDIDAVVSNGGTGITPRDCTFEAIAPLLDKTLDGFGEAFRRLSWEQVGARSVLSRALAGSLGGKFVAALPGSPAAVRLAVDALLVPVLAHATSLLTGRTAHDETPPC